MWALIPDLRSIRGFIRKKLPNVGTEEKFVGTGNFLKIEYSVKNGKSCQKSKILAEIKNLIKNRKSCQK